jgi:hypothetical protein
MKRLFILAMIIFSINCTLDSCLDEKDQSQCAKHSLEAKYNYCSCFKIENPSNENQCMPFFANKESQKVYYKHTIGYIKEWRAIYPFSHIEEDDTINVFEKETYDKDDIIKYKEIKFLDSLTEEDKKIMKNHNTCFYRTYARFVDPDHYVGERTINISDINLCFNVDRFEDNKNIMDCTYTINNGTYKGKPFSFINCFWDLDINADADFSQYYKEFYFKNYYQIYKNEIFPAIINKLGPYTSTYNKAKSRQLQVEEIQNFKMVVVDRYGNRKTYDENGDLIDGDGEEPSKFVNSKNSGSFSCLNLILLLSFILFLC